MTDDFEEALGDMRAGVRDFGDGWTLLILWQMAHGTTRFEALRRELGIARNILSGRLKQMIDKDLIERVPVARTGRRKQYALTARGREAVELTTLLISSRPRLAPPRARSSPIRLHV